MSQIKRLFWRADYEVSVKIDGKDYKLLIPREYLEMAEYEGEDIHKYATEFALDGLEERGVICKEHRCVLYLHVFNSILRQLPLSSKKSWAGRIKSMVGRALE